MEFMDGPAHELLVPCGVTQLTQRRDLLSPNDTMLFSSSFGQEPLVSQIYKKEFPKVPHASSQNNFSQQIHKTEKEIVLTERDLEMIPKIVYALEYANLQNLDISRNRITELEGKLFTQLKQLKVLNVSKNMISHISCKISNSSKLERLLLDDNQLEQLPLEVGTLTKLNFLSCCNNSIKFLPQTFKNLKNLVYLNVSGNKLKEIPSWIRELSKLEELYAQINKLKSLPSEFQHLNSFKVIGLDWFQYTFPPLPLLSNEYVQYQNGRYVYEVDKIQQLKLTSLDQSNKGQSEISFMSFMKSFS